MHAGWVLSNWKTLGLKAHAARSLSLRCLRRPSRELGIPNQRSPSVRI